MKLKSNIDSTLQAIELATADIPCASIAGLDEAGRGPLAGPVYAAAVVLPEGFSHPLLQDSKKLTARRREEAAAIIMENALSWGVASVSAAEIDRINILKGSITAMHRALAAACGSIECEIVAPDCEDGDPLFGRSLEHIEDMRAKQIEALNGGKVAPAGSKGSGGLPIDDGAKPAASACADGDASAHTGQKRIVRWSRGTVEVIRGGALAAPELILVDGNRFLPYCTPDGHSVKHLTVVKGDALVPAISAASILAKTFRDSYMQALSEVYPQYGWDSSKAYPTPAHYAAIARHGLTAHHRRTFIHSKEPELF